MVTVCPIEQRTHTHTFIKQELTCRKAVLHSLYRLMRQRKEKWLAHDYSTVCVCVCVCVCVLHGGETGREVKSKVSGHLRAFLSTYFLKNTYLWLTTLQLKKIAFCVCVPYEYVSVSTHTYVLTQSMLVEGVGVKREKTGGIQIALETKGTFVPTLDPTSGLWTGGWNKTSKLELEEQEVLILLEESFKVQ